MTTSECDRSPPAESLIAVAVRQTKRFELGVEQVLQRRLAGNPTGAEQTEGALFDMSIRFLRAYADGELPLPPVMAKWLVLQLENALGGHPAVALIATAGAKTPSLYDIAPQAWAMAYMKHAKLGTIIDGTPERTVETAFQITDTTRRAWHRVWQKSGSTDVLGKHLSRLNAGEDPTEYALARLRELAEFHKATRPGGRGRSKKPVPPSKA